MKKEVKIGMLVFLLVALIGATLFLVKASFVPYAIITGTFAVISLIVLIDTIMSTRNAETVYNSNVKRILRTYDAILVKSNNLPKVGEKNIIKVDSIEDLVDAQMEIRKPIYYQQQQESCAFVLLDNTEACVYITKMSDDVICPLEITLNEIELKHKNEAKKDTTDESILSEIERTTILQVDNDKYVKVSPVRKQREAEEITEEIEKPKKEVKVQSIEDKAKEEQEEINKMLEETEEVATEVEEVQTEEVEEQSVEFTIPEMEEETVEITEEEVQEAIEEEQEEKEEEIEVLEF